MKKYLLSLALFGLANGVSLPLANVNSEAKASYIYGENIVYNGDFKIGAGEYVVPGGAPSGDTVISGMGTFDANKARATKDETNPSNTIMKFTGGGFASFYKLLNIEKSGEYKIEFDYKVDGTTDNIGFAFWCITDGNRLPEVNIFDSNQNAGVKTTDLANNWKHIEYTRKFEDKVYDSMHFWCNVNSATIYTDNFKMVKTGTTENIFKGGDFEGFLDYGTSTLTMTPNENKLYGQNVTLGTGNVKLANDGIYGLEIDSLNEDLYTTEINFDGEIASDANLKLNILNSENASLKEIDIIKDGVSTTKNSYIGTFNKISDAKKVQLEYSGSSELSISYFTIKPTYENAFDPTKTYYEDKNLVVNGDFEKFDEGTKFSETQLEGAWGSVSLDNPGRIVKDGDNKVASIGKNDESDAKNYSSMFLMTPDDLTIGDLVRFQYDYKLTISDDPTTYTEINSCFVGGANVSYYKLDLSKVNYDDSYVTTSGAESAHYAFKKEVLPNGYTRVTLDFQVMQDKIQWNSVRWLFTPHKVGDTLYVDNVNIKFLSETPFTNEASKIEINSEDLELFVGETKDLTYTITPSDATNKDVTWKSSNEKVCTVNNGKITAIGEGVCEISVETTNGKKDSIVVTVLKKQEEKKSNGGAIAGGIVGGVAGVGIIAGAIIYFLKRKK